jgi:hypothetical protein
MTSSHEFHFNILLKLKALVDVMAKFTPEQAMKAEREKQRHGSTFSLT